jgi:hypothetical protein
MKKNIFIIALLMIAVLMASCVKDEMAPAPEPEPDPEPGDPVLVHYWHFNEMTGETVTEVPSDFSAPGLSALITYPGTGDGYMDARTHREADPVSNLNLRMGQAANQGAVLRARNPAITRELFLDIPSTGHYDLVFTLVATRSENGSQEQQVQISFDGGSNWTNVDEPYYIPSLPENEGYVLKEFDLSEFEQANDNPNLKIRILFVGAGNDNPSGNNRFDNITLDGVPILGGEPAKLSIPLINLGQDVYAGEEFSIDITALDDAGLPAEALSDITITISVANGSGNLSGTLSGVIPAGEYTTTVEGLIYDAAEEGVILKVEANGLQEGVSDPFDVLARIYNLTLSANITDSGELSGAGEYPEGAEVTIEAIANEGFVFLNWTLGEDVFANTASHTFNMPGEDLEITANFEELPDDGPVLIHYWHFNTMDGSTVTEVAPDYSVTGLSALITYPGTGDGYMDARTHRPADPVSNFNLRMGQQPNQGAVLRVRNPANTRELLFQIPSTGYEELVVTWAATRSDNGGTHQRFEFSADGGNTWQTVGDDIEIPFIGEGDDVGQYAEIVIELSGFPEVNNNPDLYFRILAVGEGADNLSGNQRIDNFTLDGLIVE